MFRLLLAAVVASVFSSILAAQSLTPTPAGKAPQAQAKPPAPSTPSPSATPTVQELVDSLGPADLQAFITLLKGNFTEPDAITDTELNRATVEGLLVRLPRGITLLPGKESVSSAMPGAFYSEVIAGRIGYVRLGTLNHANLQALDKALGGFAGKKVNDLIVDLRASPATNDLSLAAELAKRFCPKGKPIFTLRKPVGRQDRVFSSDREPAFRGLIMVLADGDTTGAAEAIAAAVRFYNKALVIGQPTAGRAAEYSDFPLPDGKIRAGGSGGNDFARRWFIVSGRFKTRFARRDVVGQRSIRFFSRAAKKELVHSFTTRADHT